MTYSNAVSFTDHTHARAVKSLLICISFLIGCCVSSPALGEMYDDILTKGFNPEAEIDLSRPGLEKAAELLNRGDVRGCREAIAEYFSLQQPKGHIEQWPAYGDAIERADAFLNDTYMLGEYQAYALPGNPTWSENPPLLSNWQFLYLAFEILTNVNEAYRLTGNELYLTKAKELIIDFSRDNVTSGPLPSEYSWYDHSVAYRSIFFIDFWSQWVKLGERDNSFALLYLELIWRHARYLASRNYYPKSTNHGIYCNIALFRISLAFPQFREAALWKRLAVSRMEQQVRDNYSIEGIHREYSPSYHILTAELLDRFCRDCRADRSTRLSRDFISRVSKITANIPYLFHPDGKLSLIGDSQLTPATNIPNALAAHEPTLRYVQTNGKQGHAPRGKSRAFRDAQFFVMRSGWGRTRPYEEESYLIADLTAYGNAHQHYDFMSFELSARGFRWMTDLGALTYDTDDPRRRYITSGIAHNVVVPYVTARRTTASQRTLLPETDESYASTMEDRLVARIKQIKSIDDVDTRIAELEKLLPNSTDNLESKILLYLAYCYEELKGDTATAETYLERVLQKGPQSGYYELAKQALSARDAAISISPNDHDAAGARRVDDTPERRAGTAESGISMTAVAADIREKPTVGFWSTDPRYDYLEGYFAYSPSFEHARAILFIKPYFFLVVDRLRTKDPSVLKELFHMPPEVAVQERNDGYLLSVGDTMRCLVVRISHPDSARWRIVRGQEKPEYQGWYSGVFGNFEEAPVLENSFAADSAGGYCAHLFVPLGRDDVIDYDIEVLNGQRWDPGAKKPLRLTINERHYRTEVTFMPSSRFLGDPRAGSVQSPLVHVSRRRR